MAHVEVGDTFGGYRIEAVVGRGGMGVVYRAEQPGLGRQVALKVIAPEHAANPVFQQRFQRESRLAASIEHPNAIPIYEAGVVDDETMYLVMRYVDGVDLATVISRDGPLDPSRAARIVQGVAGALDEAHAAGLVHRDVKPGNVLIESRRGQERALLTDFGLTKLATEQDGVTATGNWVGTIDYASPEQIRGKRLDARSDVYALGCVMFCALTGRVPFERETDVAKLYAHANDEPPSPGSLRPGIPPELDEAVRRALAKDPEERFPSAGDFGRAATAGMTGVAVLEPERSVASGEAAPGSDPGAAAATPPPPIAPTAAATAPGEGVPATEAPPPEQVAPTADIPSPPGPPESAPAPAAPAGDATVALDRPGRRPLRPLLGLVALAAVLGVAAFATGIIGGSDEDSGGGDRASSAGGSGRPLEFVRRSFEGFSAEVPEGWTEATSQESLPADAVAVGPSGDDAQLVFRSEGPASPTEVAATSLEERSEDPGFADPTGPEPVEIGGAQGSRISFRFTDPRLGPNTEVITLAVPGTETFRVRVSSADGALSGAEAEEIVTRAAETLEQG